ncbi:fatty acid desaturase family protein [Arthrobacter sp. QXT-31]|uniref:fatty acid desaturase family protein n=1 Tax=Arthrobacter sp. QXT-31 TaxID=1357915 RepID=UPI000971A044|nr:acyl-CoA desaturase [Arthrobacter sp. QXT-31]APX00410.1 acyl-CoA desaturase [Arthrobacter sp. QXT-31]
MGVPITTTVPSLSLLPIRGPLAYSDAQAFPVLTKAYLQLSQQVRETGLLRRTPWFYALVGGVLAIGIAGCAALSVLLGPSWFQLLIAAALGILFTQVAFLAHEAGHRQILAGGPPTTCSPASGRCGGVSYSWWDSKHSRHHANPNKVGRDPDIEVDTISSSTWTRQSQGHSCPDHPPPGLAVLPAADTGGPESALSQPSPPALPRTGQGPQVELGLLALRFAAVLLPLFLLLPPGMALAFLGVQLGVFGLYMGATFAPNHKGMPVIDRDAKLDFFSKQVRTSRNISGGWWATWLMGGLNYQVEHHLFPSMPRPHLAKARRLVREQCTRLSVPYTETSIWSSYGTVITYLNRVGLAARDPFECPMTAQYRRR